MPITTGLLWVDRVKFGDNCNTVESHKFDVLGTRCFILKKWKLSYKDVGIKIYNPKNTIIVIFLSIKHKFWALKRNVSGRRFFYAPKTYFIIGSY